MAVDPKTGKPVPDLPLLPDGRAFAEYLAAVGVIAGTEVGAVADDFARAAAGDARPRGVSVLRGVYGPWPAAQEMLREGRP
jgi:hypothetical protein